MSYTTFIITELSQINKRNKISNDCLYEDVTNPNHFTVMAEVNDNSAKEYHPKFITINDLSNSNF